MLSHVEGFENISLLVQFFFHVSGNVDFHFILFNLECQIHEEFRQVEEIKALAQKFWDC